MPDKGHVTIRYDDWDANRPRGMRRQAELAKAETPPAIVPAPRLGNAEATRRWAALRQQLIEVDPFACPTCHGVMRVVACITPRSVIDRILSHRRTRAATAANAAARRPPTGHAVRTATEARRRAAGRPLPASRPSRGWRSRRILDIHSTDPD